MQVSEIFYSIQGEGVNIGVPAIFIRLSGCHLRCVWCDTKYTWPLKAGKQMTHQEIISEIKKHPSKNLVITGGEPLIQQKELKEFLEKIPEYYVEIETSGNIYPKLGKTVNHYNCSPKLSNSKNVNFSLKKFPKSKTYYKFVIDNPQDLHETEEMVAEHNLDRQKVILMPQGTTKDEVGPKMDWLAELCKEKGFRLTPRLHLEIWGNQRMK